MSDVAERFSSMVLNRSTSKIVSFNCWFSRVTKLLEGSLPESVKELVYFPTEPMPLLLISFLKASEWFLSFKVFTSSRLREVSEVLDKEYTIGWWIIKVLVEKGCSMVTGEVCEFGTTCGCSFTIIAVWGYLWP